MSKYHAYKGQNSTLGVWSVSELDCIHGDWITVAEIYMRDNVNRAEE